MQITRTRKVESIVTEDRDVPDYFFQDGSVRGLIVDVLVDRTGMKRNRYDKREDLYDEDIDVVDGAIRDLTDAYDKADKILAVIARSNPST